MLLIIFTGTQIPWLKSLANVANYFYRDTNSKEFMLLMLLIIFYRDTNSMVEEFMLLANVANYFLQGHKFHG